MTTSVHDEVLRVARDLIRMDTSNYGDQEGPGERKAAEHVAALAAILQSRLDLDESA